MTPSLTSLGPASKRIGSEPDLRAYASNAGVKPDMKTNVRHDFGGLSKVNVFIIAGGIAALSHTVSYYPRLTAIMVDALLETKIKNPIDNRAEMAGDLVLYL